jgi:hypothetical protein
MKTSLIRKSQSIIPYSEEEKEGSGHRDRGGGRRRDEWGGGGEEESSRNGNMLCMGRGRVERSWLSSLEVRMVTPW